MGLSKWFAAPVRELEEWIYPLRAAAIRRMSATPRLGANIREVALRLSRTVLDVLRDGDCKPYGKIRAPALNGSGVAKPRRPHDGECKGVRSKFECEMCVAAKGPAQLARRLFSLSGKDPA